MVNKKYYERPDGFSYLLNELREKTGRERTDVIVNDAADLGNELCDKYSGLTEKENS